MASRWWQGLSRYQWTVLAIAWLGWMFDIYDYALFNFAKTSMLTEMLGGAEAYKQLGPEVEGKILTFFLLGWAVGGLVFGVVADRWGRTRTMVVTILIYSLLTGATALCQTWEQVLVVRFLTAIGIGGEWAAGAALVAEVFPDRARAGAAALLQSAAALGPVFAALTNLQVPVEHWRWLFLIGIVPALLTVFIRALVKEPDRRATESDEKRGSLRELFTHPVWRRHTIVAFVIGVAGIGLATNASFWLPNLVTTVSGGLEPTVVKDRQSYASLMLAVGTFAGVMLMPWVCERLGRRPAIALFMLLAPLAVLATVNVGKTWTSLFWSVPLMSLFSIGISAGFVLYFPELFPSRLRATGAGIAYNCSRFFAAGIPWLSSLAMGAGFNIGKGVAMTAVVLGLGILVLPFATETKGVALAKTDARS
jgi:MFS family permease